MAKNPFVRRQEIEQRIQHINDKIAGCEHAFQCNKAAMSKLQAKLKQAKEERDALNNAMPIAVSDHALVRFMERELGMDMDIVRQQMISPELQQMVNTVGGTGKYPVNGARVVMKDYTIVTYLSNWEPIADEADTTNKTMALTPEAP